MRPIALSSAGSVRYACSEKVESSVVSDDDDCESEWIQMAVGRRYQYMLGLIREFGAAQSTSIADREDDL